MFSLEPELEALRPRLGDAATDARIARERREVFSVYPELRIAGWLGATLLAAAAGVLLKDNLDRIGPLALSIGIGLAAAACYVWTWLRRKRASVVDDYVLLLGALLVSTDVAFVEAQFHLFGEAWKRHLLFLAVFHGLGAYLYNSRILLSLAISALAGYLGIDPRRLGFGETYTVPAFGLSALLITWDAIDQTARPHTTFSRTFEHFAALAALFGGLMLMDDSVVLGALLTVVIAAGVVAWALRVRHEPFVYYAVFIGTGAAAFMISDTLIRSEVVGLLLVLASIVCAVTLLFFLHARFKELR